MGANRHLRCLYRLPTTAVIEGRDGQERRVGGITIQERSDGILYGVDFERDAVLECGVTFWHYTLNSYVCVLMPPEHRIDGFGQLCDAAVVDVGASLSIPYQSNV